jgi:hypothetical protein
MGGVKRREERGERNKGSCSELKSSAPSHELASIVSTTNTHLFYESPTVYCIVAVYFESSTGYTVTVCTSTIQFIQWTCGHFHRIGLSISTFHFTISPFNLHILNLHILHSLCPRTIFSARVFFIPFIPFIPFFFLLLFLFAIFIFHFSFFYSGSSFIFYSIHSRTPNETRYPHHRSS